MRIGRIAYLNVFPFYHALDVERWGPWIDGTPRALGRLAREGRLDAAPLPVVDTFELEETFRPLGDWGIACRGAVGSVLLFSARPFVALSGARLLFTGESATSVQLARQLLDLAGVQDVQIETGDDPTGYEGFLAIGDRALRLRKARPFAHCTDLCERWLEQTGLPFVFARWVVRRTVPAESCALLERALAVSVQTPLPDDIPNSAGLDASEARAYLNNMTYRFDESCHAAVRMFRQRLHVLT